MEKTMGRYQRINIPLKWRLSDLYRTLTDRGRSKQGHAPLDHPSVKGSDRQENDRLRVIEKEWGRARVYLKGGNFD